jgi:hypothetical protein
MLLAINDNKTVGDLQDKFNDCYPFLKIEFYNTVGKWHGRSQPYDVLDSHERISDLRKQHISGVLEIKSWFKPAQVEHDFQQFFGLSVHVFFLKNDKWIHASADDDATLAALNQIGQLEREQVY